MLTRLTPHCWVQQQAWKSEPSHNHSDCILLQYHLTHCPQYPFYITFYTPAQSTMKNTFMTKEELQALPFNDDDITSLLGQLGYTTQNISRDKDSTRVLIDIGCNFVDQIIDYCKMIQVPAVKPEHIQAAIRMKFGQTQETRQHREKEIERLKLRAMELQRIDEKANPNR